MNSNHPGAIIIASLAGVSWVDKIDLVLRWGAATTAIVLGLAKLYQMWRGK
jgi:hypothetical protein